MLTQHASQGTSSPFCLRLSATTYSTTAAMPPLVQKAWLLSKLLRWVAVSCSHHSRGCSLDRVVYHFLSPPFPACCLYQTNPVLLHTLY
jgi:hypothetical protein